MSISLNGLVYSIFFSCISLRAGRGGDRLSQGHELYDDLKMFFLGLTAAGNLYSFVQ